MSPMNVSDNPVCVSLKENCETQMSLPIPDDSQTPNDKQTIEDHVGEELLCEAEVTQENVTKEVVAAYNERYDKDL
jgi:hypothetical protein